MKKTTQRKEDKMIKCEADNYGNVVVTIMRNGVEMSITLDNNEVGDFANQLEFQIQEANEAYHEFASKHKD